MTARDPVLDWLEDAEGQGASEVYFEIDEDRVRVRWRGEGALRSARGLTRGEEQSLLRRLKVIRDADTLGDERYRGAFLPRKGGFVLYVKILEKEYPLLDEGTPLSRQLARFTYEPWGLLLFVGPRASGKTRLLLSSVGLIHTPELNVISAVFPADFDLHGVNQIRSGAWQSFLEARRLRNLSGYSHVMLFGDIGRGATAAAAVEAAIGRLVLGTLESDDAVAAIQDLTYLSAAAGFSVYDLSRTLNAVVSTRLLRRVCDRCKAPHSYPVAELTAVGIPEQEARSVQLFRGGGCRECRNTGSRGLTPITEVLGLDEPLREAIAKGASAHELRAQALRMGTPTLHDGALEALRASLTTPEEIARQRL